LLPAAELVRILESIRSRFGLASGAEVTTEANPESVDRAYLETLRAGGFTRVSFGMQSAREHVLAVLDRQHTAGRAQRVVEEARAAGFTHINLDLIYGAPGETDDDWRASLQSAIDSDVDHVSAYALIVEPGTRLAARIARGELPMPDDDVLADRYEIADAMLSAAGLEWYEVSNWAGSEAARGRHNSLYWTGGDWWGAGPGAHSHVGGVRWWNVKHPAAYAQRIGAGFSPAQAREVLDEPTRRVEDVMLRLRLREGLPASSSLDEPAVRRALTDGLLDRVSYDEGRLVLTVRGRLLADAVIRAVLG
jgi:oxygen-independent coproporphyrinogen-3 oxidase